MKVSVELIYEAMPSDREVKTIQEAGHMLTSSRKSVSVVVREKTIGILWCWSSR